MSSRSIRAVETVSPQPDVDQAAHPTAERLPTRPYLLESSTVRARYDADRVHAEAEIEQIENDILVIRRTANTDIEQITARADTEIAAREDRRADLLLIVNAASAAITAMSPQTAEADEASQ